MEDPTLPIYVPSYFIQDERIGDVAYLTVRLIEAYQIADSEVFTKAYEHAVSAEVESDWKPAPTQLLRRTEMLTHMLKHGPEREFADTVDEWANGLGWSHPITASDLGSALHGRVQWEPRRGVRPLLLLQLFEKAPITGLDVKLTVRDAAVDAVNGNAPFKRGKDWGGENLPKDAGKRPVGGSKGSIEERTEWDAALDPVGGISEPATTEDHDWRAISESLRRCAMHMLEHGDPRSAERNAAVVFNMAAAIRHIFDNDPDPTGYPKLFDAHRAKNWQQWAHPALRLYDPRVLDALTEEARIEQVKRMVNQLDQLVRNEGTNES